MAFTPKSTKGVAHKILVRPKLEYAVPILNPYSKLGFKKWRKYRRQQPAEPVGDREILTVLGTCSMSCNGHFLRPGGITPNKIHY